MRDKRSGYLLGIRNTGIEDQVLASGIWDQVFWIRDGDQGNGVRVLGSGILDQGLWSKRPGIRDQGSGMDLGLAGPLIWGHIRVAQIEGPHPMDLGSHGPRTRWWVHFGGARVEGAHQ